MVMAVLNNYPWDIKKIHDIYSVMVGQLRPFNIAGFAWTAVHTMLCFILLPFPVMENVWSNSNLNHVSAINGP